MDILPAFTASDPRTPNGASIAKGKLDTDYQSFLKLLIAQVSNQNPLEPMDSTAFVSQLAQLTQVEQSIVTNSNLERMDARLSNMEALSDVQLIGREVTVPTERVELRDGTAAVSYTLSGEAEAVTLQVKAEDGTVVREFVGLSGAGRTAHAVAWDGLDFEGLPVPDGVFQVIVDAKDSTGKPVAYETTSTTRVEELTFRGGQTVLILRNGEDAYAGSVSAIR